ncbi:MAG: ATP-dependent RNA helicase HrpA [Pseudohongiellaceae bacterium]
MPDTFDLEIDQCQIADQHRLRRKYRELLKKSGDSAPSTHALDSLRAGINSSLKKCESRQLAIPSEISFPELLPVSAKAKEISALLMDNQVLVVAGDTGSGKTTQIPKLCLAAGFGRRGLIGHTQPRRLAALSVADRIADELGVQVGKGVGYQVRFNEKVGDSTFLKLMTDGILLAEIQQDRFLNRYEVLIIDEAHERSLNIDFLLGFLKQLLPKRPDLKLIITSATIDLDKFSKHFNNAPIVAVSGRTYPVETVYQPLVDTSKDKEGGTNSDLMIDAVVDAVSKLYSSNHTKVHEHSDVLVFLASEREIRDTATAFRKQKLAGVEVLPLYARLRHTEQVKIFKPHKGRRVVLSTNVAETSITVPGIRYVVDTGFARISRYSLQSKVQRLPIEPISQASANQRQGRCGRVAEGTCVRLYSETDFHSRSAYTDPEIKRTNLASVILRMRFLRLGDVDDFPFLEIPEKKAINEGFKLLYELNALTPDRELTAQGRCMAKLPIDPKFARMLVVAESRNCLTEVLIIVSALGTQDPRETNAENKSAAQQALQKFNHADSDFLTFVNLWQEFEKERQRLNQSQLRKYCKKNFLSYMRMREWREVHRQLLLSCQQMGWTLNKNSADYKSIHECIISGSLNQIACKSEENQYLGNRNRKFKLLSSSVLARKQADWIVTGDLIETHQVFASMAAKIQPDWVEQMALHLVKREYFEPHWSKKRQRVMAYEKVHLYGLTILEKSLISFSEVDPETARALFISEGIVGQQLKSNLPFYVENIAFLSKLAKQEDKIRRPDFILSDSDIIRFYEEKLPDTLLSTRQLETWFRNEAKSDKNALNTLLIEQSELLSINASADAFGAYPDEAVVNLNPLSISYVFDPLDSRDGATIDAPSLILNQLTQGDIDWSVPGTLREKSILLLKSLPKAVRKNFIPVSGFVDDVLPLMRSSDGSLLVSLLAQIRRTKKLKLDESDFANAEIPPHLQIKIRVLDTDGQELATGTDLQALKKQFALDTGDAKDSQDAPVKSHPIEEKGLTDWSFKELPRSLQIGSDLLLIRYPALVDENDSVAIRLFADEAQAWDTNRQGLMRLLMLRTVQQCNSIKKAATRSLNSMALKMGGKAIVEVDEIVNAVYSDVFDGELSTPRSKQEFEELLESRKGKLILRSEAVLRLLASVVDNQFEIRKLCASKNLSSLGYAMEDVDSQLANLLYDGFLSTTSLVWLEQFPRYLEAITLRIAKAPHLGVKDRENTEQLQRYWGRYTALRDDSNDYDVKLLESLRWHLEELRVSLFAQNLGTKMPVSFKRVDKQIELIR